jgi:hypothetical protein
MVKLTVDFKEKAVNEAFTEIYLPVAKAGQAAIEGAGNQVKTKGRADIAAAGFSQRWQNALRVDIFPKRPKVSARAAAFIYHNIPYATVFEEGAIIRGKPRLWLPLKSAPKRAGRHRITPALYSERYGKLEFIKNRGKPLLGVRVRLTTAQSKQRRPKVSLAAQRRGTEGKGKLYTLPLFVGVPLVQLRKRFNIRRIVKEARDALAGFFFQNLKDE